MQYVLEPKDSGEKRRRLSSLPKSPTDAYRGVINRMTPSDLKFARRILGWVLHAQRILKMPELQELLAIEIGIASLNRQDTSSAEEIISSCGGFVVYDLDNDLVTFSHETVRPFLEKNDVIFLPSHSVFGKTCLTYLQLSPFDNPSAYKDYDKRKNEFVFSDYAAKFWASHVLQSERDVELETMTLEAFSADGRREAMGQLCNLYYTKNKSLFHLLIERGLTSIFTSPFSSDEAIERM